MFHWLLIKEKYCVAPCKSNEKSDWVIFADIVFWKHNSTGNMLAMPHHDYVRIVHSVPTYQGQLFSVALRDVIQVPKNFSVSVINSSGDRRFTNFRNEMKSHLCLSFSWFVKFVRIWNAPLQRWQRTVDPCWNFGHGTDIWRRWHFKQQRIQQKAPSQESNPSLEAVFSSSQN